ncbi:MAG TPA: response regulator, partial [Candidatus Limnocylindria bacterium]
MGERPPPRAFVIEDDVLTLALLSDLAEMCGFEPVAFTRISSAREALRGLAPAIMVVDDDLPDGRGTDLVREVRANPRTADVRVVFCTAAGPSRRREIAQVAPVIAKPFRVREVERVLQ